MTGKATDLAWAAGFFDGEGCFSTHLQKNRGKSFRITIVQVDREVLDKFHQIVQVGNVTGPYSPPSHRGQPYYLYRVQGRAVIDAAKVMWPYLGTLKRSQFRKAVALWRSKSI